MFNSCLPKWSIPRVYWVRNCQIIPCLMCPFGQVLHLILIFDLFVIADVKLINYDFMIIIIIMSRHQHGYPWPSFATLPYRPLLPAGLQGYNPRWHKAAVYWFKLVFLPLLGHVKGSTGVHHLWARIMTCSMNLAVFLLFQNYDASPSWVTLCGPWFENVEDSYALRTKFLKARRYVKLIVDNRQ